MKKTQNNGSSTSAHSIPATPPESLGNIVDASTPIDAEIDAVNGGDTLLTVHRIASRLFQSGAFDKATMRQFDEICLTPIIQMGSSEIRELREHTGVSQAVLARILNVTVSTVGQWERGEKKPTGSALKLLALMQSKGVGAVL
jgi:putative transcriptional regulator